LVDGQEHHRDAARILVKEAVYELTQPAPIPEWQVPGDARAKIRIEDILHMSSGLRTGRRRTPTMMRPALSDHLYLTPAASIPITTRQHVRSNGSQLRRTLPHSDPVLISYLIRLAVEKPR